MTRRARRWIGIGGSVALGLFALVELSERRRGAPIEEALVVHVTRGDLVVDVTDTGKVEPAERVSIKSKVPGEIRAVHVKAGERVEKGQRLVDIDTTDLSRDVARAEAERLTAEQAVDFAAQSLARKRAASSERAIALAEVDTAEAELNAARARLRLARVSLASARDRLGYASIRAPMAGTVLERNFEPGEVVVPGMEATLEEKPLLVIGNLASLHVRVELNQIDVARVVIGQPAVITLDALPGRSWSGRVTKIAPAAVVSKMRKDRDVFPIEVAIDTPEASIKAGMTADVRVRVEERNDVLKLPIEAIVSVRGDSHVNRILGEPGREVVEPHAVDTGLMNDLEVEVRGGVSEGEAVLIQPPPSSKNEAAI